MQVTGSSSSGIPPKQYISGIACFGQTATSVVATGCGMLVAIGAGVVRGFRVGRGRRGSSGRAVGVIMFVHCGLHMYSGSSGTLLPFGQVYMTCGHITCVSGER